MNVPDHRMSLSTTDPEHFRRWLSSTKAPKLPSGSAPLRGEVFAPRAVFGQYVGDTLAPLLRAGAFRHQQDSVIAAQRESDGFRLKLASGTDRSA